ncbi:unnamed protein product, partial [Phaeothamnion confervicola]
MSRTLDEALLGAQEGEQGDEFVRGLFEALLLGTRASNAIPAGGEGGDFEYNASFPEFAAGAKGAGKKVLELIQVFLDHVQREGELDLTSSASAVEDAATDPEAFEAISDVVEQLLEEVDGYLDDVTGQGANKQVAVMREQLRAVAAGAKDGRIRHASMVANVAEISKPQLAFADDIDNARDSPFVPRLNDKPNAVAPLDLRPEPLDDGEEEESGGGNGRFCSSAATSGFAMRYPHPYAAELAALEYRSWQLESPLLVTEKAAAADAGGNVELPPPPLSPLLPGDEGKDGGGEAAGRRPLTFVDTEVGLAEMLRHIDTAGPGGGRVRELAVDLEAHSWRSFQGLTCLMQLSTRERDFVIDTLALRLRMRRLLPAFTDPDVVKVLHGADSDVLWLQRDLGLYLVNLFDTGQAARYLGLPSFSYAHLLARYCAVMADK